VNRFVVMMAMMSFSIIVFIVIFHVCHTQASLYLVNGGRTIDERKCLATIND
jgi:hypothetical protein